MWIGISVSIILSAMTLPYSQKFTDRNVWQNNSLWNIVNRLVSPQRRIRSWISINSLVVQHQIHTKHYKLQMEIFNNAVHTLGINFIITQLPLFDYWLWCSLHGTFARRKSSHKWRETTPSIIAQLHSITCPTHNARNSIPGIYGWI